MNSQRTNIILGSIIALLVVAVIILSKSKSVLVNQPALPDAMNTGASQSSESTTKYQTFEYSEGDLAYSFQYPVGWSILQSTKTNSPSGKGFINYLTAPVKEADTTASLAIYQDTTVDAVVNQVKNQMGTAADFKIENGSIDGIQAQVISYTFSQSTYKQYIFQNKNQIYVLLGITDSPENQALAIDQNFFDSFHFTNLNPQ